MDRSSSASEFIRRFSAKDDLRTFDPYDVWKTRLGFLVKDFYNHHRYAGLPAATLLTLFHLFVNDRLRLFYQRQEFPIVRAQAALALLNVLTSERDASLLPIVRNHLNWLIQHSCTGYSGPCWGLGFRYAVDKNLIYGANTPLTTMTPYALEAFVRYSEITNDPAFLPTVRGIFRFLENDIPVLEETGEYLVTAYSTMPDRKVINAVSYVMYSYSMLLPFIDSSEQSTVKGKIAKLYNWVRANQRDDGSWLYSPDGLSFVDCFHSCFVLKNLIKTMRSIPLSEGESVVRQGYRYVKSSMFVPEAGLFKRFAETNKPGIVRFDLYDNAEMLNLAKLIGDFDLQQTLETRIAATFIGRDVIYSQVDIFGLKHSPNTLRWAAMPYLYALSVSKS